MIRSITLILGASFDMGIGAGTGVAAGGLGALCRRSSWYRRGAAAGGAALGYCIYRGFQDEIDGFVEDIFGDPAPELSREHRTNKTPSNKPKHEKGDERRKRDHVEKKLIRIAAGSRKRPPNWLQEDHIHQNQLSVRRNGVIMARRQKDDAQMLVNEARALASQQNNDCS
ncbi:MAG: hypothetical protein R3A47_06390 [Polyangiales bacterium]